LAAHAGADVVLISRAVQRQRAAHHPVL